MAIPLSAEGSGGENERLEKAFQLASFIVRDRSTAISIVIGALARLKTQCNYERKRGYWRDKYLKRGITRTIRTEADTLQWLIYFESEKYERQMEREGASTDEQLVIRYIAYLVRLSSALSSFHVNIAVHRLLHAYSTSEIQKIYEFVTERYVGADQYRRAKGVLVKKLESRFGNFLTKEDAGRGEIRFQAASDQGQWQPLVDESLTNLVPWSTVGACPVPPNFNAESGALPRALSGKGQIKLYQDALETSRSHVFIDPVCFVRLVEVLGLPAPHTKLAVPRFSKLRTAGKSNAMEQSREETKDSKKPWKNNSLDKSEFQFIDDQIREQEKRREEVPPSVARILLDGVLQQVLTLDSESSIEFEIEEGAELIEIRSGADEADLLLATLLIRYNESGGGFVPFTTDISLGVSGNVRLSLSPLHPVSTENRRAAVSLCSHSKFWARRIIGFEKRLSTVLAPALAAGILVAIGWMLASHNVRRTTTPVAVSTSPALQNRIPSFELISDNLVTRGAASAEVPVLSIPSDVDLIELRLPIENFQEREYRAVLKQYGDKASIVSERFVAPQPSAAHVPPLTLLVPAKLIKRGSEYQVTLQFVDARVQDVDSFSFYVAP